MRCVGRFVLSSAQIRGFGTHNVVGRPLLKNVMEAANRVRS